MTPPHFQLDDEVEIIGTTTRFKISQIWKNQNGTISYSALGEAYHPASSLRLVEELKIGDWVEVIGKPMPLYAECLEHEIGRIFEITQEDTKNHEWFSCQCNPTYPPTSLRKLTPDEIAMHTGTVGYKMRECADKIEKSMAAIKNLLDPSERLAAIESRLNKLGPSHAELLSDVEAIAERIAADEKRLAVLEGERPGTVNEGCEVSRSLYKQLMSDRPEATCVNVTITDVCESQSKTFDNRIEALDWCKKALGIKQ